jgi:hypothetical protein
MPIVLPNHGQGTVSIAEASNLSKVRYLTNNIMERRRGRCSSGHPFVLSLLQIVSLWNAELFGMEVFSEEQVTSFPFPLHSVVRHTQWLNFTD